MLTKIAVVTIACATVIFLSLSATKAFAANKFQYHDDVNNAMATFGKQLAYKYKLEYLTAEFGSLVDAKDQAVPWCISMIDRRPMTLDQARPIVVALIDEFWNKIVTDKVFQTYLTKSAENSRWADPVLTNKRFAIKVAYWDEKNDRPMPPYLAQVRVKEGYIEYYYADPKTEALVQPPITETFEEAYSKVSNKP